MKFGSVAKSCVCALLTAPGLVYALPLTTKVPANGVECFYAEVRKLGSTMGFSYSVQSGGSFDIDLNIKAPDGNIIYSQQKEKQGEYGFAATQTGEYEFCFSNDMSTFSEKTVEFEVHIDSTIRASLPENVAAGGTDNVERSVNNLESQISSLHRALQYYKTRNNRNESTVKSTETRIFWFSFIEVLLMVGMGLLQVTIVQLFFQGSRKHLV